MLIYHVGQIHTVQLVAGNDEVMTWSLSSEVDQVLAYCVSGALIPTGVGQALFGCEYFGKAIGKGVEDIRFGDMHMQGGRIELGQDVYLFEAGIDAIGYGNIHYPVFATEGYRRLGPVFCQRIQSCPLASAQNYEIGRAHV